ncbi:MAG: acyl-ACP desaturase [Oceanococcaceae bacterium]
MTPFSPDSIAPQREVLNALAPQVEALVQEHLDQRQLWMPSELLDDGDRAPLRDAARGLPETVRAGLALNLLTEEGLPHFHRLIAVHMGEDSVWNRWNNIWTAEEDRHGCVLRDYARDSGIFDMVALERLQYAYLEAGFNPDWGRDPYKLLAYTSLQEKATQRAHGNLARLAAAHEPRLQMILSRVAGDEARHHRFYRDAFALILREDPERALKAAWAVMPNLAMPGHTIPGYDRLADAVRAAGIYGPMDYCLIVQDLLATWGIAAARGLSDRAEQLQEQLMALPKRLERFADLVARRRPGMPRIDFDFLPRAHTG